jgi:acyl-CoA thioesterase-2
MAPPDPPDSAATPLDELLRMLVLDSLDRDLLLGETPKGEGRLFGGLVAAQSVMAAGMTVERGSLHSLHAYFLRPGRHGTPIRFLVHRIRDGRTFTTRRVVAHQAGEAIFNLSASFAVPEEGISHQAETLPDAPPPEELPDFEVWRAQTVGEASPRRSPLEVRVCDPDDPDGKPQPPNKRVWIRPAGALPEVPLIHAAVLVYASDRALLSTAARPHGLPWGRRRGASLDHALWIHRPIRFDDWLLYDQESPVAHAARGLCLGAVWDRAGRRLASVAQEALIRVPRG